MKLRFSFSRRRRHTRCSRDWSSDVCSSDLLPSPFFVLATQNPIELEGTYPLPEAQLDRFLFNAILDDLSAEDELKVIDLTTATRVPKVEAVTSAEELLDFQQLVRIDRKSTRLNSSHGYISYAVFCLNKNKLESTVTL